MLHLAGASNIFAQPSEDSTADSAPTSTPSPSWTFPAVPQDTIHPTLLQYMYATQDGDAKIQDSANLPDTGSSNTNTILSAGSPSGYGLDASPSPRIPRGMPGATGVRLPPTQQPLPQVPANSKLWSSFEPTHTPFTQRNPGEAACALDSFPGFDSIFRFQAPSLHTQYPQLSGATQTPTAGPSPASNDLSRGFGISEMRMRDTSTGGELDFTRIMAENVPGLTDGMGVGWEAFLTGWHP